MYVVIVTLTFGVCTYGKQELSEAYLLEWDEWTNLSNIYRAREHYSINTICGLWWVLTVKNGYMNSQ